jgi:hypothetical protein
MHPERDWARGRPVLCQTWAGGDCTKTVNLIANARGASGRCSLRKCGAAPRLYTPKGEFPWALRTRKVIQLHWESIWSEVDAPKRSSTVAGIVFIGLLPLALAANVGEGGKLKGHRIGKTRIARCGEARQKIRCKPFAR